MTNLYNLKILVASSITIKLDFFGNLAVAFHPGCTYVCKMQIMLDYVWIVVIWRNRNVIADLHIPMLGMELNRKVIPDISPGITFSNKVEIWSPASSMLVLDFRHKERKS